jgi:hypothetical protein
MSDVKDFVSLAAGYGDDLYAWTTGQAAALRALRPAGLDWENLAEEIDTLGRSQKYRIESNLSVVLLHLLKLRYQPESGKSGWRSSVIEHRRRIERVLRDSPSLRRYPGSVLAEEYETARLRASDETGLPASTFPRSSPFTIEQVLDPDFWPEGKPT